MQDSREVDFDEIKRVVFDKFEYDIESLEEVKILVYITHLVLLRSELRFEKNIDSKINAAGNMIELKSSSLDEQLEALNIIFKEFSTIAVSIKENSDSARESVIKSIKSGAEAISTFSEESVKRLTEHMGTSTERLLGEISKGVAKSVSDTVDERLSLAFDNKLNDMGSPLMKAIASLHNATDDLERRSSGILESVASTTRRCIMYAVAGASAGCIFTFLLLLLLQNSGVINIPFNVTLDARSVSQYILNGLPVRQ